MATHQTRRIRASVLHGAKDLRLVLSPLSSLLPASDSSAQALTPSIQEIRTLPPPAPEEIQVAVSRTGLCGSDLHYYTHFRNGDIPVLEPLSLGHESSGVVVAVGPRSNTIDPYSPSNSSDSAGSTPPFRIGDRVALEVGQPCGQCARCEEGRYNICPSMKFRSSAKGGLPHAQGTLQERINVPARWCHKLPGSVSLDSGALVEPLSVAVHACRRAVLTPGKKVLVLGAGTVGMMVAAVARSKGAERVVIADLDEGRVEFAARGKFADQGYVVPRRKGSSVEEQLSIARETAAEVCKLALGDGKELGEVDAVFECTGAPSCLQMAIYVSSTPSPNTHPVLTSPQATRPGGSILLIGMGTPIQTLPISHAALREIDLLGVFRYADSYPEAISLLSRPRGPQDPNFETLITHRVRGLENVEKAFEIAGRGVDGEGRLVIKVVVETDEGSG